MRRYPALDVLWPAPPADDAIGLLLANIDDHAPLAVEERPPGVRVFFGDEASRDAAHATLGRSGLDIDITAVSVDDEDWAERSQAALRPVRIERCIIAPPWTVDEVRAGLHAGDDALVVVIQPSMGFGTGHHASTRLCLALLQRHLHVGARVVDIGTGSGVLALASAALGASTVVAVDVDRDALTSAAENVALNGPGRWVDLDVVDITDAQAAATLAASKGPFDMAFANITGALLQNVASTIGATLAPSGVVIASGFENFEADEVAAAFIAAGMAIVDRGAEGSWTAIVARHRNAQPLSAPHRA